ncbi:hypothetical protein XANCAGTX0491_001465 [Xanthoria calcicola]
MARRCWNCWVNHSACHDAAGRRKRLSPDPMRLCCIRGRKDMQLAMQERHPTPHSGDPEARNGSCRLMSLPIVFWVLTPPRAASSDQTDGIASDRPTESAQSTGSNPAVVRNCEYEARHQTWEPNEGGSPCLLKGRIGGIFLFRNVWD